MSTTSSASLCKTERISLLASKGRHKFAEDLPKLLNIYWKNKQKFFLSHCNQKKSLAGDKSRKWSLWCEVLRESTPKSSDRKIPYTSNLCQHTHTSGLWNINMSSQSYLLVFMIHINFVGCVGKACVIFWLLFLSFSLQCWV